MQSAYITQLCTFDSLCMLITLVPCRWKQRFTRVLCSMYFYSKLCLLEQAITSPCKVDLYLKQNQSVDSVSTELDNLELSDDASQSQDQNAEEADCSHQRKFEANLRSEPIIIEDSAQSLNVMTTGSLVQSEDGTMHSSASGSSGLPDYQDNYDQMQTVQCLDAIIVGSQFASTYMHIMYMCIISVLYYLKQIYEEVQSLLL